MIDGDQARCKVSALAPELSGQTPIPLERPRCGLSTAARRPTFWCFSCPDLGPNSITGSCLRTAARTTLARQRRREACRSVRHSRSWRPRKADPTRVVHFPGGDFGRGWPVYFLRRPSRPVSAFHYLGRFRNTRSVGTLHSAESLTIPPVALNVATNVTEVHVELSTVEIAQATDEG